MSFDETPGAYKIKVIRVAFFNPKQRANLEKQRNREQALRIAANDDSLVITHLHITFLPGLTSGTTVEQHGWVIPRLNSTLHCFSLFGLNLLPVPKHKYNLCVEREVHCYSEG